MVSCICLLVFFLIAYHRNRYAMHNVRTLSDFCIIDETRKWIFNMSYAPVDGRLHGYGRPIIWHDKLYKKVISLSGDVCGGIEVVQLPGEVTDRFVGEAKGMTLDGQFHVYTNFWGSREELDIFPTWASQNSRDLFFSSGYKNYLWNTVTGKVVPMFYDTCPGKGLTHKNFLLFEHLGCQKEHLAVTQVSPHIICCVDLDSGYMRPRSSTQNSLPDFFGLSAYLSGGPVRLADRGCYLVAGHVAKGAWGGLRMTFFYTFRDSYPFDILSVSKPVSFGFSNRLEYCNQLFELEGSLYISLGVNDSYSVLLQISVDAVLAELSPLE